MKRERRMTPSQLAPVAVEKRAEGELSDIVGYGAVFYDGTPGTEYRLWEDLWERIMPGSFDRALEEDDVRGLFNHDPNNILGRTVAGTMALSVDKKGLRYSIEPGNTTVARNVIESINRGDVSGSSFSFQVTEQRRVDKEVEGRLVTIREIVGVRLYDVGPVTFPAYTATEAGIRADDQGCEMRDQILSQLKGASNPRDEMLRLRLRAAMAEM